MAILMTKEVLTANAFLSKLADRLSGETSIRQVQVLFAIAMAGESGTDSASIERKLGLSAAAVSRTIRVLSKTSYDRSAGFGLVDLDLDPNDNRRRVIKLNAAGAKAITGMTAGLCKGQ